LESSLRFCRLHPAPLQRSSCFDAVVVVAVALHCLIRSLHSLPLLSFYNLYYHNMARRYDSSTTTFSPEGRLHQVEYAIEAINNAGTCVGILAKDGIVMASERRITSGLLAPSKVRTSDCLGSCVIECAMIEEENRESIV
jgi:hypothetical protein